jgi:hypothetical protein
MKKTQIYFVKRAEDGSIENRYDAVAWAKKGRYGDYATVSGGYNRSIARLEKEGYERIFGENADKEVEAWLAARREKEAIARAEREKTVVNIKDGELSIYAGKERDAAVFAKIAAEHGFEVDEDAFRHNIAAWQSDYKSGYLCAGAFVFSPCGCNDLIFRIEKPNGKDYQHTYMA